MSIILTAVLVQKKLDTEMFQSIENKQHVCACLGFTRTLASRMVLEVVSELNDAEYLMMQDVIQSCLLIKYTYEFLPSDTFCFISNCLVFYYWQQMPQSKN